MKITSLISLSVVSLILALNPLSAEAKENGDQQKSEKRHVTVKSNKADKAHHVQSKRHHVQPRRHHVKPKRHHDRRHYNKGHKKRHYNSHKRRHRNHALAEVIVGGVILHSIFGRHGSHYNGHAWCPLHHLYHTHTYYHYDYPYNAYTPYKVESYIDLDEGKCYKVIEYSNGDQRRKRIRDHHCAEMEEWMPTGP